MNIRPASPEDLPFLRKMLYEAARITEMAQREGVEAIQW